jgi:inorganic triphosphatase YgiF
MEIELKFGLDAGAVKRAVAVLARLPGAGAPATHRLDARYFDTAANDLRRAGLTLRLRVEDGRQVQTVKSGGAIARGEWNDPVEGAAPDLASGKCGR